MASRHRSAQRLPNLFGLQRNRFCAGVQFVASSAQYFPKFWTALDGVASECVHWPMRSNRSLAKRVPNDGAFFSRQDILFLSGLCFRFMLALYSLNINVFFFWQGNSNSLASVDLNAGYVGSSGFNFYLVAVLLTINTYSSAILSLLILLYNSFDQSKNKSDRYFRFQFIWIKLLLFCICCSAISDVMMSLTVMVAMPFTVFMNVAVAFQNHIFVWTVFSPKLIYEYFHLCLTAAFILVYYMIEKVF